MRRTPSAAHSLGGRFAVRLDGPFQPRGTVTS